MPGGLLAALERERESGEEKLPNNTARLPGLSRCLSLVGECQVVSRQSEAHRARQACTLQTEGKGSVLSTVAVLGRAGAGLTLRPREVAAVDRWGRCGSERG